jgi:hypothetical protein
MIPPTSLSILRTETVLSRFPIHNLTKHGNITIRIRRADPQGNLDCRWEVSYNEDYGQPGPLAYKLDTIVINQLLDTLPRPLPWVLKVGSLRQIGTRLGTAVSGRQQAYLKRAFHQNASAYIVAKLRYYSRDGTERHLEAGFTRYSVILTGERLPDGTRADGVYLVLSPPYREVLTHAPVRPLDYTYLTALTPIAQRFYEILSYKMFAALKYGHAHATLRYGDYCVLATLQRAPVLAQVQKHMYKVHQPHLASGYLGKVQYEATTDTAGQPDWLLHYTPGPKARTEYAAFMRQPGADTAAARVSPRDADQDDLGATIAWTRAAPQANPPAGTAREGRDATACPAPTALPRPVACAPFEEECMQHVSLLRGQAQALVAAFYQRFHGLAQATASPKEVEHALQLLTNHGEAKAQFLLTYAQQAAPETHYQPQTFMGILHYLHFALAAYDAQATQRAQATQHQATLSARRCQERYLTWRQEALTQLRSTCPPAVLSVLDAEQRARLVAAGTPAVALDFAIRVAVDDVLAAQAQLPPFEVWRQQLEEER